MTNYNERLDEVLNQLVYKTSDASYGEWQVVGLPEAKQAVTSLIKELVADAKPEIKAHPLGPVTLADCQRGLDHYEANLLKAFDWMDNVTDAVNAAKAKIQQLMVEERIDEIGLMQHQARVNLKTSNAVADWGDIRIAQLKKELE